MSVLFKNLFNVKYLSPAFLYDHENCNDHYVMAFEM